IHRRTGVQGAFLAGILCSKMKTFSWLRTPFLGIPNPVACSERYQDKSSRKHHRPHFVSSNRPARFVTTTQREERDLRNAALPESVFRGSQAFPWLFFGHSSH